MSSIRSIEQIIKEKPFDSAFVVSDFLEYGDYETIKKSLTRLEKKGNIRRVLRGVYDKPAYSYILNEYAAPSLSAVAEALARRFNWDICPCGDTVLNDLGLSTQVPSRQTYISSGPYRIYEISNRILEFKHAALKEIAGRSKATAIVVQALKTLGKDSIDNKIIDKIGRRLSDQDKKRLIAEAKTAPIWMYKYMIKISEVEENV